MNEWDKKYACEAIREIREDFCVCILVKNYRGQIHPIFYGKDEFFNKFPDGETIQVIAEDLPC